MGLFKNGRVITRLQFPLVSYQKEVKVEGEYKLSETKILMLILFASFGIVCEICEVNQAATCKAMEGPYSTMSRAWQRTAPRLDGRA